MTLLSWVGDGTSLMSGSRYISSIQLRSNTLYTKGRAARGRPRSDSRCEACKAYESLRHLLQGCSRTWAKRTERHDVLVRGVMTMLQKRKFNVLVEPSVPTEMGIRKPDIVAMDPGVSAVVLDLTIITDSSDLRTSYELKKKYYENDTIREWVSKQAQCPAAAVSFSSITFNWRGALCKESATDLLALGLTKDQLRLLSVRVVEKGFDIWLYTRKATV